MIRNLIIILSISFFLSSCNKTPTNTGGCTYTESTVTAPPTEVTALLGLISVNHPTAVLHPSGFYYEIISAGTGGTAKLCSSIVVKYTGTLLYPSPGFKFDENLTGTTFVLGSLIIAWQKGIPLINSGGIINLYIPPTLGYGATGSGAVPANAYLAFSIQLSNVL